MLGVLRLYGGTAALAFRRALRAWPVAFSLVMYAIILLVSMRMVASLGVLGGFIVGLIIAACFSSYLHLISFAVAGSKITLADVRQSFGARIWDVISVLFAFWVIGFAIEHIVAPAAGDRAYIVMALLGLAMAVFFNPVPELLYQSGSRSFHLLLESGTFVSKYGLEWFVPNILAAVALLAPLGLLHGPAGQIVLVVANLLSPNNDGMAAFNLFAAAPPYLQLPMLAFVHWFMIFRGLLYAELMRGGSRQRNLRRGWGR